MYREATPTEKERAGRFNVDRAGPCGPVPSPLSERRDDVVAERVDAGCLGRVAVVEVEAVGVEVDVPLDPVAVPSEVTRSDTGPSGPARGNGPVTDS